MKHQHFQEVSFIPTFHGIRVDGEAYFFDVNDTFEKEERLSITASEAFFKDDLLWVMSDLMGPFIIASLYDVCPPSHLKGLATVLASAFIDER